MERQYGPRPAQPLFPWQFHAETNAAKLADIRSRRSQEAADADADADADKPKAGEDPLPPPVHPYRLPTAPACSRCCHVRCRPSSIQTFRDHVDVISRSRVSHMTCVTCECVCV
jgi:hypothetical protein